MREIERRLRATRPPGLASGPHREALAAHLRLRVATALRAGDWSARNYALVVALAVACLWAAVHWGPDSSGHSPQSARHEAHFAPLPAPPPGPLTIRSVLAALLPPVEIVIGADPGVASRYMRNGAGVRASPHAEPERLR